MNIEKGQQNRPDGERTSLGNRIVNRLSADCCRAYYRFIMALGKKCPKSGDLFVSLGVHPLE
jgi:hypothetical protein